MTYHATHDVDRLLASLARTITRLQPRQPLPPDRRRGPLRTHRFGHESDPEAGGSGDTAEADVLAAVRETAGDVHERLGHDHDVFAVELLGATGAGKTALLESLLGDEGPTPFAGERVGVVTGDVAGTDDADRLRALDVPVVNVTTGRDCHLDPERVDSALDDFDLDRLDVLVVENVGNMVCPADFPLGTDVRAVVVSPTEGDDVVRKHPLLFQVCDVAVLNKGDVAAAVGADVQRMADDVDHVAPETPVVRTSAETGAGIDELSAWLVDRRRERVHSHG
ncbi:MULTISPECIES: hydrogenase nickel incorporation protein HypB [Haloarcula]|uniref:hydrogenase nickel incorporation protein HypB n=1 Tax=Haloarcula TaxID=2237 RepID=UPI0023EBC0F2|nr:hydrogenase nickel incorporation protein HypB [Halomicroarcula sp. XH51]